ncbi:oligosaccharide flippase family protein [Paenirhodobacter populi]|nr:oligosaccharide flippase family protein [Sinirhodobacter populi]
MAAFSFSNTISLLKGEGTRAKAMRASVWVILTVVFSNGVRLLSNMILTRLLFPEAFGLMALVQIFITGLQTFSDVGIRISIIQNKRGDDPDFLNTAWTLQIIRGVLLWVAACVLAWPASVIYGQPQLMLLLPVTALSLVLAGMMPTRVATANRHLNLGRLTMVGLTVQLVTVVSTALLAWWWHSVWALAVSALIAAAVNNTLSRHLLPGEPNRLRLERDSVREIIGFGKFVFLSTISTFLITTSDRAILGAYFDVDKIGIYTVGLLIGTLPNLVVSTLSNKVLLPLYRMKPTTENAGNRRKLFRARRIIAMIAVLVSAILAFIGPWLIGLLYDPRYALAGPMVTLFTLSYTAANAVVNSEDVLLANGDSRRYFIHQASVAALQICFTFLGIHYFGLLGAILAPGLAKLVTYPIRAAMTARYGALDLRADMLFMLVGGTLTGFACFLHWPELRQLLP